VDSDKESNQEELKIDSQN